MSSFLCTRGASSAAHPPEWRATLHVICLLVSLLVYRPLALGQAPYSIFVNKTTVNGLGDNFVNGVYVVGSTVYAATAGGLSISTNGGITFSNKTTDDGLGSNFVRGVYVLGSNVYAATYGGLGISTDGGKSFSNKTTADGLDSLIVSGVDVYVYRKDTTVYAATGGGLSISTNGGKRFINLTTNSSLKLPSNLVFGVAVDKVGGRTSAATAEGLNLSGFGILVRNETTADGLGSNTVNGVGIFSNDVTSYRIYAATSGGLSMGYTGDPFVNKTTANGLGNNLVYAVYSQGLEVYAATQGGLSISTDQGESFSNRTTANGLGSDVVNGVYALNNTVYAATRTGLSISVSVLPVRLVYFQGRSTIQGNQLSWQTSQETDNAGFTLLRGSSPTSLEAVASIPSLATAGTASATLNYSFLDRTPPAGLSYYQLRQTDRDGQQTLSRIIALHGEQVIPVLFPNPVPADGQLRLEPPQAFDHYELVDAAGRVVQRGEQAGTLSEIKLPKGEAGLYWLRLQSGGQVQVYPILR